MIAERCRPVEAVVSVRVAHVCRSIGVARGGLPGFQAANHARFTL